MKLFIKKLVTYMEVVAKEDMRLFFAPFVGAYKGIKKEFKDIDDVQKRRRKN